MAYGIQLPEGRGPLAFAEALDEDVATYIREDPEGPLRHAASSSSAEHLDGWGFKAGSAEPILKSDWHALSFWGDGLHVFVPRANSLAPLKRAPPRVLAFIEALRRVNVPCWEEVLKSLSKLQATATNMGDEELSHLVDIFSRAAKADSRCALFGAIEAQVWSGGELTMQSHTDGATAMLHLGLTLGGQRMLRVGKFRERHSPYRSQESRRRGKRPGDEVSVWNEYAYEPEEIWDIDLAHGSAYISLPFCFEHGVSYESPAGEPVIALQCRLAFTNESEALEVNGQRTGNMRAIAERVADALAVAVDRGELRLPSLPEVQAVEAQLALEATAGGGFGSMRAPVATPVREPAPRGAIKPRAGGAGGGGFGEGVVAAAGAAAGVAALAAALCGRSAADRGSGCRRSLRRLRRGQSYAGAGNTWSK